MGLMHTLDITNATGYSGVGPKSNTSTGISGTGNHGHENTGLSQIGNHGHENTGLSQAGTHGHENTGLSQTGSRGYESTGIPHTGNSHYTNTVLPQTSNLGHENTGTNATAYGAGTDSRTHQSDQRGLGAEAHQQGNHYTSTTTAGSLGPNLGLGATKIVDGAAAKPTTGHNTTGSSSGNYDTSSRNHGLTGGNKGLGGHLGLGSDHAVGKYSDRYLYDPHSAPGLGGHATDRVDKFTHENINHLGSGSIITGLRSDLSAGKAESGAGVSSTSTGTGDVSKADSIERQRKPMYNRNTPSRLQSNNYGLNSGRPRESVGDKIERKAVEHTPAAGIAGTTGSAGAAGYDASHSGREPISGQRGSGIAGEPYDGGNQQSVSGYGGQVPGSTATTGLTSANTNHAGESDGPYGAGSQFGNTSTSTTGTYGTGVGSGHEDGLKERFAGVATGKEDDCVEGKLKIRSASTPCGTVMLTRPFSFSGHHNLHPAGEAAHQDGTHKPTFLNYQHDTFGVPVAKE